MSLSAGGRELIRWCVIGGVATVVGLATFEVLALKDNGWWGYLRLVSGGATTLANVVETDPQNHCLAGYSFTIAGHSYRGSGEDCYVMVGQGVIITYLKSDPKLSCLGLARDRLANEIEFFITGGVLVPPVFLIAWKRRKRPV